MQLVNKEVASQPEKEACIDWIKLNVKDEIELFLGISCLGYFGVNNAEIDLLDLHFDWFEFHETEYVNQNYAAEDRKEIFAFVRSNFINAENIAKFIKKPLVRAFKNLQKKGLIEVVSSKSWRFHTVNIHNPSTK